MNGTRPIFTIGHSNHDLEHFLFLLDRHEIDAVADVRSSPFSKFNPHFNREPLSKALSNCGIKYVFLGDELGARRSEEECYSENRVDYELVATLPQFKKGIERLLDGATKMRVAMMCAEKDPLTCHRSILVARYLDRVPGNIMHILANGEIEEHESAERRLLNECQLGAPDLFVSEKERLSLAYAKRAREIAYVEPATSEI